MLAVPGCFRAFPASRVIAAQHVKEIARAQPSGFVRAPVFVDQQKEIDSGFLLKDACVIAIAQADRRKRRAFITEGLPAFVQLRDVLPAEDSSVVAKKNDDSRIPLPQRTQASFLAGRVG